MKKGARRSYRQNGQKSNWRRAVWNEILKRTNGREQKECILYLAGPEDIDRRIALSKGVPECSLIAIDRDPENVSTIRAQKGVAVRADALDLLWTWPATKPVCVVLLDFCSGICNDNLSVYDAFQRPGLRNAVVMVNFQRGRDPMAVQISDGLQKAGLLMPLWKANMDTEEIDPVPIISDLKHRAYLFLMYHALDSIASSMGMGSFERHAVKAGGNIRFMSPKPGTPEADSFRALFSLCFSSNRARFFSYRSGVLTFDSAVFEHPERSLEDKGFWSWAEKIGMNRKEHDTFIADRSKEYASKSILHRIGAAFAVATRRTRHA